MVNVALNHCKDCDNYDADNAFCGSGKIRYDEHFWSGRNRPLDGFVFCDSEQYGCGSYVGPEFGCIHFTPRLLIPSE